VKGDGGAFGLTENSAELLRWMVSGPELTRMINEFETSQNFVSVAEDNADKKHHEDSPAVQRKFHQGRSVSMRGARKQRKPIPRRQ